jgi:hypothetical protein
MLVAACREPAREGTPCTAVATRQLALAEADLGSATVDPATRRLVEPITRRSRPARATSRTISGARSTRRLAA